MDEPDLTTPEGRLEAAICDLSKFRREWADLGEPSLAVGSQGQPVPHPHVRLIREAERAVEALSRPAAVKLRGRPVGAVSARDRLRVIGQ